MKCDELKPLIFSLKDFAYIDELAAEKNFENPHDHAVYKATEVDAAIAELKQNLEDAKATAYAESVDAGMRERRLKRALWLEQNLKKLNRTIWLCRAWAARNLALYYKLWCERYKDNSNESLASCYLNDSKKWESFYHKFKALADKFKEEA